MRTQLSITNDMQMTSIFATLEKVIVTHFYAQHSTKSIPIFLPADGEASCFLLPSTDFVASSNTTQPENTFHVSSCKSRGRISIIGLVLLFSYYILMRISKCDQASDLWQQLELDSELESDLRDTVDWGKKWLVDFNAGKTQLVSFDWSNNIGSIDVKMGGSVLEETSSFEMQGLTSSSKLDWGPSLTLSLLLKLPARKLVT